MTAPAPKLLDQARATLRTRHYSIHTETAYLDWMRRFILFHGKRHPESMGAAEVSAFLTHLAVDQNVAASTQNQALNALVFLYREVLQIDLDGPLRPVFAKRPKRLPSVLTRNQVLAVINRLPVHYQLMAQLLYGSGLRLMECLRLRVKDLDFDRREIVVRDGKGMKDRITMLPGRLSAPLQVHLAQVRQLHQADLAQDLGSVYLPFALERKYPNAHREWIWQYVFPSDRLSADPRATGSRRRHHVDPSGLQKAVRAAAIAADVPKRVTCHTFRHSFATHLLEARCL